jgi:hypothetical protein
MEDVPPGTGNLLSEYQAVVAAGYEEEALLHQALEASKANEDKVCPGYSEAIALTGMVANLLASLPPPPPPLPPHAPLMAAYEGQEVPPPPGVSHRRRDHPHGVVINPPPPFEPEPKPFIDLVPDEDE